MTKLAFDTETKGFGWYDGETAFLGSWADAKNEYVANLLTADGAQEYENALKSAGTLVGHNTSFDVHQTRATLDYDILSQGAVLHDTDIKARIAIPTGQRKGSYKLKDLTATFVNEEAKAESEAIDEMAKSIGVSLKETPEAYYLVWRAYPDVMELYAKKDARYTYDLDTYLDTQLDPADQSYGIEQEVIPILTQAEATGVKIDQEVVQKLKAEYEALEQEAREPLIETFGSEKALKGEGSKQALLDALLELGVPLYRKTKSGELATHKWALQEFTEQFPILDTLMEWRKYDKFLTTYINPVDGRDVVHTSFKQCEAWTGRMSSARPNMQNIPKKAGKEARSMFVPREDHVFVVYDYDSIEVRLLAYYMANEAYRKLIREGLDPHAYMAGQIHGRPMEEFTKENATPEDRLLRDIAKNTMFAISYGAGAPRVADMNQIPKAEAKELIKKIKKSLPGYYRLNSRIRKKIESVGYVNTAFGKKQVVDKEKAYVGLNALIQGTAAQIMKRGLIQVHEATAHLGAIPLLLVHDEIVVECHKDAAEEVSALMPDALCTAFDCDPPLQVEGGIVTTNYADA